MEIDKLVKKMEDFISDTGITQQSFMMRIGNKISKIGAEEFSPKKNLEMSMKLLTFLKGCMDEIDSISAQEMFLLMDADVRDFMERALLEVMTEGVPNKELTFAENKFLIEVCHSIDKLYMEFKCVIGSEKPHNLGHKKELVKQEIENALRELTQEDHLIIRQEVADALNECFHHSMRYNGIFQVFPRAVYQVNGKRVLALYDRLELDEQMKVRKDGD